MRDSRATTIRMRKWTTTNMNASGGQDGSGAMDKRDSLGIVYEISQKIATSQEVALVAEISDLGLFVRSEGATRKILWTAGRRPILNSPFERSIRFLRGKQRVVAMRVFFQCQHPFLFIHDTEELFEKVVTLEGLARTDDDQLRPGSSQ